jgi:ribosomal protein S17E
MIRISWAEENNQKEFAGFYETNEEVEFFLASVEDKILRNEIIILDIIDLNN